VIPSSPTFYYPLTEHAPFLTENCLSVSAFRESWILFPFMNSLRLKEEWVRSLYRVYDPHRGFFHIDPVDPHINVGLPEIAQRLSFCELMDSSTAWTSTYPTILQMTWKIGFFGVCSRMQRIHSVRNLSTVAATALRNGYRCDGLT